MTEQDKRWAVEFIVAGIMFFATLLGLAAKLAEHCGWI
jgi:hypothetical protein